MIKLYKYLKPFALFIFITLILLFIQSMSDLYLPTLMADIVNKGVVQKDIDYIKSVGLFMLLIASIGALSSVIASYFSSKISMGFGKNVRAKVFSHIENFSLNEFDKLGTASLITRTTNDITQVQMVTLLILRMMIYAPIMCIGGIIMAVSKDAKLSLVFVVILPLLIGIIAIIALKGFPLFKAFQKKVDKLSLVMREGLIGIRVIRAFNKTTNETERFDKANVDLTDTSLKVNQLMAFLMPVMMVIMNITSVAIIWFGGLRVQDGGMEVGNLMAFIQYAMQILFSLIMVSMMFVMVPRAAASAERINEVLDTKPDLKDTENPIHLEKTAGNLEFKDVTFSYAGAEMPALYNISFMAKSGETTAIIGGTGSGKSTLINLIPRFYDIDSGEILLDGVNIAQLSQENLRSTIGYVPQKAVLFSGTISENIKVGKEDATEEEIIAAAKTAQAYDFISEMQDGFQSVIAEGGTNVSGGQKQRLSIARAVVRKPLIYVFDDSFSALDFKTDALLREALKKETEHSTVIIVAQRVSTVIDADKILVLDDGKIVGIGTHKELLKSSDVYREIVSSQLSEEEINA